MVRAQSSIDRTVDWNEKLRTASPESFVRDPSPVLEGRNEPVGSDLISCHDDLAKGSVERSISAVMAIESNSRSRKATQRLGLFRENEQAIEERGKEKQRREEKEREKERERQEKQRAKETEREERKKATAAEGKEQGFSVPLITRAKENEKKLPQESSNSLSVSRTRDDRYSPSSCDELSAFKAVPGDTPSPASHFVLPDAASVVSFDIAEPALDSSSSPSVQRGIDSSTVGAGSSEISASIVAQEPLGDSLGGDQDLPIKLPQKPTEHIRIISANQVEDDEDEESDKDEISSALYFPHSTLSVPQDPTIAPNKASSAASQPMRRDASNVDVIRDGASPVPHSTGPEFDLSIQSGDDEYHYHAGRRSRTNTDDDYSSYYSNNGGYSSGFSEYSDSNDELSGDEIGQDGSEIATTPTATPVAQHRDPKRNHHSSDGQTTNKSHSHKAPAEIAPQVPLGAVELKPYNHQVGGHTALFRFSRRAVCKSLSNKENEFYEAVEKRHPELLGFLPK